MMMRIEQEMIGRFSRDGRSIRRRRAESRSPFDERGVDMEIIVASRND
jgi:hypothetical protein